VILSNFVTAVLVPSDQRRVLSRDKFDLSVIPHLQPHILAPRGNERTDRLLACSLLERRSSPHPFFIIDSSVWSSAKRSCYSLMSAIHLHHALCHDKIHQEVRGCSRKDTFTSHCRAANKTHSLLPYCKSSLLDRSCDECRRSRSEIKDQELRTSCFVRQFVLKLQNQWILSFSCGCLIIALIVLCNFLCLFW